MSKLSDRFRRNLQVEGLEARTLMAADITSLGGVLNVSGTMGNDQIEIAPLAPGSWLLKISVTDLDTGKPLAFQFVDSASIQSLVVHADAGNDHR